MTANRMTWIEDWKKAKTRPRVSSPTSRPDDREAGRVRDPGQGAEQHHEQDDRAQHRHQADERERHRGGRDGHAEQPAAAEVAEQPGAQQHAERHADEDRGEDQSPAGAAAVQRVGDVGPAQADDHAGRGERAHHADDQAADHRGRPDELPALPDGPQRRRDRDLAAGLPLGYLVDEVDGERGDEVRGRVEVQGQIHVAGVEQRRDPADPLTDQRQHAEQAGRAGARCRTW